MKKRAFTLGEVLITLTIVGVVAILIVPSLVNNIGDKSRMATLKSTLSDLNNAVQTHMIKHHIKDLSDETLSEGTNAEFIIENLTVKRDEDGNIIRFTPPKYGVLKENNTFDKNKYSSYKSTNLYLNNGVGIAINPTKSASSGASYYSVFIDTNGDEAPNIIGLDAFEFMLLTSDYTDSTSQTYYAGEFYPIIGTSTDRQKCQEGDANTCAFLVIDSGFDPSYYKQ